MLAIRRQGGDKMYANLLGQKAYHHLSNEDMGKIIGVSRNSFCQKIRSGRFWPNECQAFCRYFNKPFDYLFATENNESNNPDMNADHAS